MGLREWFRSRRQPSAAWTCLCGHVDFDHDRMGCAERGCNCVSYTEASTGKMRMG